MDKSSFKYQKTATKWFTESKISGKLVCILVLTHVVLVHLIVKTCLMVCETYWCCLHNDPRFSHKTCDQLTGGETFTSLLFLNFSPTYLLFLSPLYRHADRKLRAECFSRLPEDVTTPANISSHAKKKKNFLLLGLTSCQWRKWWLSELHQVKLLPKSLSLSGRLLWRTRIRRWSPVWVCTNLWVL